MTTKTSAYSTTFHRDHTVTIWNVYNQQWERTARPSDRVLASLTPEERHKVTRHCRMWTCGEPKDDIAD